MRLAWRTTYLLPPFEAAALRSGAASSAVGSEGAWTKVRLAPMGTAPAARVVPVVPRPEAPGLRKPRKTPEDSGRSLNGRQAFIIARETRDCGTPETPEAEDGTTHSPAMHASGHPRIRLARRVRPSPCRPGDGPFPQFAQFPLPHRCGRLVRHRPGPAAFARTGAAARRSQPDHCCRLALWLEAAHE